MERTLAILKPDGVEQGHSGKIIAKIEAAGFKLIACKMIKMTKAVAEGFYSVHKGRPFYEPLIDFMTEGPSILLVLEKENAVQDYRKLMGSTDPENAAEGTIRKEFAENTRRNVVHGSDSPENAEKEISFFFSTSEVL